MANVTLTSRLGDIGKYRFNPAMMQRVALSTLKDVTDGTIDIVDASNPFVFALETTAVNTAAFMQQCEALNRRQYPIAAVSQDDIYLHMSDKDYIGRFALPSKSKFTIVIEKNELINELILDPITGIKKITIPRNTTFKVADTLFSLQYPIDIRKLAHGGLQIVYDTTVVSPLQELETNLIEWNETATADGVTFIMFSFDTHQFNIITKLNDVSTSSGYTTSIAINDSFYHARVYLLNSSSNWVEMVTTHTTQVYNPNTPTAVLKVKTGLVEVYIPSIYTSTGLVRGKLRIDVYETKGDINLLLNNYGISDFTATWLSIDQNDQTVYTQAINNIKNCSFFSSTPTTGGRQALSQKELALRVINNSTGPQSLPITNIQLQSTITDGGYEFVKNIDTITNRIFLATRSMPPPIDNRLVTAAAANMSRVTINNNDTVNTYGVTVSGKRTIISSDALYKNTNGITKLVSTSAVNNINLLNGSNRAEEINNNNYLYSPFYYVLDSTESTFSVRPYYLDNPNISSKSFVIENASTGVQVSIDSNYYIEKTNAGYRLVIKTKSNDLFKSLDDTNTFCQLGFKASDQTQYSYMLGVQQNRALSTDERIYVFEMNTNFDIDSNNKLAQNSFNFSNVSIGTFSDLIQEMNVFFISNSPLLLNTNPTISDSLVGSFQIPALSTTITHEKLRIRFGFSLDNLWSRSKSVASATEYQKYLTDVQATYAQDIYQTDPVTGSSFTFAPNGDIIYNILHHRGDNVLDSNGDIVYKNRIGDIVLDSNNEPIPVLTQDSQITRYIDVLTIEGVYKYATDPSSATYKKNMYASLLEWINNDISVFNSNLLDQTKIVFYPKVTIGDISCLVGNKEIAVLPATQSFNLTLQVPAKTLNDIELVNELNKITINVISTELNKSTVSISDIEYALKLKYGTDVIDVKMTGFGSSGQYNVITILDEHSKMSIRKKLIMLPSNILILQEDVNIKFIKHSLD